MAYSEFVDILRYKDKNPGKRDRDKFSSEQVSRLWELSENPYYQIILMLIYNGYRISEFLDLKKEHVLLDEQYFDVIASKTDNGIRKVPIADKVLPFYRAWYESSTCEYLLHTPDQKHFDYRNYYDSYFIPLMDQLGYTQTPHCTRYTCISMLAEAHVDQTMIKKIVGHSGAMTLTEKVYTHSTSAPLWTRSTASEGVSKIQAAKRKTQETIPVRIVSCFSNTFRIQLRILLLVRSLLAPCR